jgi:hypothetical protein
MSGLSQKAHAIIALGALILCAMVGLFTYISATVYKGNRWIVTTDSITQINQISLFQKQTSQLSLANLEDVTVEQNGILQTMFGFGRLRAETAGERSKFVFDYCPNPSKYAKDIIGVHEAYIAEKPEEMHTTNQALANAAAFNQSYGQPQYYAGGQPPNSPGQQPYAPVGQPPVSGQPYAPIQPNGQPMQPYPTQGQWPQAPNGPSGV